MSDESLLGRFGLAAPTPGLDPVVPGRFDVLLVLSVSLYELASSLATAEPVRHAVRSLAKGHPAGEAALLEDGAFRLVHAALTGGWPSGVLSAVAIVSLVTAFLFSPVVTSLVIGRLAYADLARGGRPKLALLLPLAARHYHRVAGAFVLQLVVQGAILAAAIPIATSVAALASNERANGVTLVVVASLALGICSFVNFGFDLLRAAMVADEVPIGRAFELTKRVFRPNWRTLVAVWLLRLIAGLLLLVPVVSLPFFVSGGLTLFFLGQLALVLRTALWTWSLSTVVRCLRTFQS